MASLQWGWVGLVQLLAAAAVGLLIGYQRELNFKPAGLTTMTIVTVTSTLLMQLSIQLSALGVGPASADPTRLAAAVITGIGFLGAGVIIQTGRQVHGITTASTIWLMTGVGLAIGAGFYAPAAVAVLLVWGVLAADPLTERIVSRRRERLRRNSGDKVEE
jgi:putative Mg2+ transporter-C (MgtC) family protein